MINYVHVAQLVIVPNSTVKITLFKLNLGKMILLVRDNVYRYIFRWWDSLGESHH